MSHLRPLHIVAIVNGFKINKVLIDGGTAISLLPERMLGKVGKHVSELVPINIAVTDFGGNSTPAKGLVTLTVKVGVVGETLSVCGGPIKGAVPSTVHQSVLLWTEDGKPEIIKADLSLYVEQMHADFRIYNRKLKPLNVDRSLNPYNCEGCYLTSEGLSVKLRYPDMPYEPTENKDDSSDKFELDRINRLVSSNMFNSTPLVEYSNDLPIICNEVNDMSQTTNLIAEAHYLKNKSCDDLIKDQVSTHSHNVIDFTFDCIYDLEPLGFEKCTTEDDNYKGFESQDPLEEVNLGTHDDVRVTYICKDLIDPFRTNLINLLYEFKDCFAWDYHETRGLDRLLVEHRLALKPNARPVKQTPRRFAPENNMKINEEIERLINAKFIRTARYVEWVSNIVPVMKKNGKFRCINFRDLNNATPKDEYFMPIADMLINSAAGNEVLSFMDSYSGYNQIFIVEDDVAKTAFRCLGALASENLIGCMLAQDDENKHEHAFYYLIRVLTDIKTKYSPTEKLCLSLYHACMKLKCYMVAKLVKAVNEQVIADFLVHNSKDLNDQGAHIIDIEVKYWKLYFDGSKHKDGAGVGIFIISPEGVPSEFLFELKYPCSNNVVEYEALILGLKILIDKGVLDVQILGDSQLVLKQLSKEFKCNNETL
ncbi:uncharacterized protein [Arachis hypogaea]|uniref:uncharacterized protein n=1 Tax=Arachis hypogaea TaxID=3818 RepID=UPI003B20F660